MISIHSRGC